MMETLVLYSMVISISDDEDAVTVMVCVEPSRISMVAYCQEACLFAHDATKKRVPSAAPARIVRHVRFGVYARPPDALNAVCFIVTSNQTMVLRRGWISSANSIAKLGWFSYR